MTSNTAAAQRSWEAENNIIPIDPVQNALYALPNHAEYQKLLNASPWKKEPQYFTSVRISALALLKMTLHARSGTPFEIMGLMTGYVSDRSLIITDAFRLPVEGTETRVNAQAEADEYQVNFGIASREGGGQDENPIGWYHSHPGYGCWLSGIDVGTQKLQQTVLDPFVAVVVDPDRTVSAGRVEIGAFRTFPEDYKPPRSVADDSDDFQSIPTGKIEDFGAHANSYYALDVQHFKSTLDTHLLGLLWNKYWVSTLSQSPLFTNRDYGNAQIKDHALKIKEAARKQKGHGQMLGGRNVNELMGTANNNIKVVKNASLEQVVRGGNKIAAEEMAGLMANEVKMQLFQGVVEEARARSAQQQATRGSAGAASG
jgi:COP9 signalosome complex subunit 5